MATITLVRPVLGVTTSGYGQRGSSFHHGMDIAAAQGTPIVASANGTVEQANYNGGYGNYVRINHGSGLTTAYAHMSVLRVRTGQAVKAGDVIGLVGSTGDSSGPHLHFEVRQGGKSTNPAPWLKGAKTITADKSDSELTAETVGLASKIPLGDAAGLAGDVADLIKQWKSGRLAMRAFMIIAGFICLIIAVIALLARSKNTPDFAKGITKGAKKLATAKVTGSTAKPAPTTGVTP